MFFLRLISCIPNFILFSIEWIIFEIILIIAKSFLWVPQTIDFFRPILRKLCDMMEAETDFILKRLK